MSTQPRGVLGPQLVRRGFLWWCAGLSCSCGRARQGVGTAGKGSSDNSDPQICHRKPPLSPAPRPSSIAYSNTGTNRTGIPIHHSMSLHHPLPEVASPGRSAERGGRPTKQEKPGEKRTSAAQKSDKNGENSTTHAASTHASGDENHPRPAENFAGSADNSAPNPLKLSSDRLKIPPEIR